MTRPLTDNLDAIDTIIASWRAKSHVYTADHLADLAPDLAALVAEVRASRQHASGGEDVLTDALDLLNLYHDALDDATAGGFSVEILRSMGNGGDVWRLMRERRLAGPPATRTHKAGTIEIDDGWYTGNCACGWQAIAQRLRRVDALKDADAHVRVASEVAPSQAAPVTDARVCPTCRAPTTSGLVCNPCEDSIAERLDATRAEPTAPERDDLGRIVRDEWMAWAREQPNPKPSWLVEWDRLSEPDREVDRRIGERLFAAGRSAERGARMLASPPAPVEPSTWTPEDAERRAREMLGEGVPLPSPPAPVEDARPVLTEWKPWSGEDDLGYACEVRDAKCDAGPLKQLVQADVLGRWWVYESSNPLDDTALARGTAPDLATAKAAAACQWYRLPDDAPAAPDAFPRAPRDAAEREAVAAVPFGDDWCFALSPVGLSCARAPGHAGDHVASEDFEYVIARWPAAPATTGGEGGK